ncbi:MAG: glycosyltransferase family 2 protein, partial [Spirochaetes bacterium]
MEEYPFVSVIIPALNAESTIGLCLESIKSLDYPAGKLEIIVVDNGSTDRTREIAESFGAKVLYKPKLKV